MAYNCIYDDGTVFNPSNSVCPPFYQGGQLVDEFESGTTVDVITDAPFDWAPILMIGAALLVGVLFSGQGGFDDV